FFLYLAHAMPHKPLAASEDFYTPDTPDDLYADVIRELDWSVGQIQKTLHELDIDRDTLLIFMSDNGASYGGDNGGLRGKKATSWDGGLRVPFIASWPGRIPVGIVNPNLAASVDLFPTILSVAGLSLPEDRAIDGKDLWPILASEQAPSAHEYVITMHNERLMTIHSGPWKLHVQAHKKYRAPQDLSHWKDRRGPDGVTLIAPFEQATPASYPGLTAGDESKAGALFNIADDPGEQRDVSALHLKVVQRLRSYAETTLAEIPTMERPESTHPFRHVRGGRLDFWNEQN
ncbi:MAG: sulfatase-like hydrolase/transferase, partial [Planctomycetes bacterium]|nr:sulfatase-like hydrolase/transferase [Planctomycetota bacterium]